MVNWLKVAYKLPRTLVRDFYLSKKYPGYFDIKGENRLKNFAHYKRSLKVLYRKPKMYGPGPYANVKWPSVDKKSSTGDKKSSTGGKTSVQNSSIVKLRRRRGMKEYKPFWK